MSTTTHTDPNAWLMGGGIPAAKFTGHGETVGGTITTNPDVVQQTDFKTGALKTWDDGRPMMQLIATLATDLRDADVTDDDGTRKLYIKGKMQQAVRDAVRRAGAPGLEVGGRLSITYIGDDEPKVRGMSGAKLYTAAYTAAAVAALDGDTPAAPAPVAPPQASPAAQPAAVAQAAAGQSASPVPGMTLEAFQALPPATQAALLNAQNSSSAAPF